MTSSQERRLDDARAAENTSVERASDTSSYRFMPSALRPTRLGHEVRMLLQSAPPISAIFFPTDGSRIPAGNIVVKGYAVSTFGEDITRVELSMDGGKTWQEAELADDPLPGEWRFWRKRIDPPPGKCELAIRAVDTSAERGPSHADPCGHKISFEVMP